MDWDPVTHYKEVSVAERYDRERFSSLPGRVFNALEKLHMRRAFRDVPRDAVVMDLPCGTGRFAELLLEEGFSVVGIDISPAMLEVAHRRVSRFGERFLARVADVRELAAQESKRYNVALCARVLMHFPLTEQIVFLRSVAILTRGIVIFTQSLDTPYHRLRRRLKKALGDTSLPARYPITEANLRELLLGAGLREVRRIRPFPMLTESIFVIAEHL